MVNGKKEDEPVQTLSEIYQSAITDGEEYTFNNVMSASVLQNRDDQETSIAGSNELSVTSIVRNEGGGYDVNFLIDNSSETVTFLPDDCDLVDGTCTTELTGGEGVSIWSHHETDSGLLGPSDSATYHNAKHLTFQNVMTEDGMRLRHRQTFVFGISTPEANQLEMGMANYNGWFFGYAFKKDGILNSDRQRIRGHVHLVADFDLNVPKIDGEVTNIRGQAPGQPSRIRTPWPNSSFVITGTGMNAAGQFTATLEGRDESAEPDIASLRGFMGKLTAQLFGPNADEIGGVVSAERDDSDHDLSLYGYISGTRLAPKNIGSDAELVGVSRNYNNSMTDSIEKGVATMNRSDSGWAVSIDDQSWNLDDSEYDKPESEYERTYEHMVDTDNDAAYLWSMTDGLLPTSEFAYFDVKGWADNSQGAGVWSTYYIIHGDRTSNSALPTTSASFQGRMEARVFPRDNAVNYNDAERYRGDLSLTVNFADASVTGRATNFENRPANGSGYSAISGNAIFNATIDGHHFTANDFSGTGDISGLQNGHVYGSFFGPAAQEAGGVLDAGLGDDLMIGYFGTAQAN